MNEPPAESRLNLRYVWSVCLISAMGGLMFGYDWVVIGGAKPFYEKYFHLASSGQIGWAMSCALVGCMAGAILSGWLSDRFGRKRLLILSGFLFVASSIGTALSPDFSAFVANRMAGGTAIGLASNLSPVYIAEMAPAHMRGKLVSVNQLTIVIGILLAQAVNWIIAEPVPAGATPAQTLASWNGQIGWRWMFGAAAFPAFCFFVLMFLLPESPRWLVKSGNPEMAEQILGRIGGQAYGKTALADIQETLSQGTRQVSVHEWLDPKLLRILLIGVFLAAVVRNQRDFQLRGGGVRAGRLRRE